MDQYRGRQRADVVGRLDADRRVDALRLLVGQRREVVEVVLVRVAVEGGRLAGQLEAAAAAVRRQKGEAQKMVPPIEDVLARLVKRQSSADDIELLGSCTVALKTMSTLIDKDPRGMWFCYQAVSSFGPLGHTLVGAASGVLAEQLTKLHEPNLVLLRQIRHLMARRQELTVIAHELRNLNESLQAITYAALGTQGPQVRRRRA